MKAVFILETWGILGNHRVDVICSLTSIEAKPTLLVLPASTTRPSYLLKPISAIVAKWEVSSGVVEQHLEVKRLIFGPHSFEALMA